MRLDSRLWPTGLWSAPVFIIRGNPGTVAVSIVVVWGESRASPWEYYIFAGTMRFRIGNLWRKELREGNLIEICKMVINIVRVWQVQINGTALFGTVLYFTFINTCVYGPCVC